MVPRCRNAAPTALAWTGAPDSGLLTWGHKMNTDRGVRVMPEGDLSAEELDPAALERFVPPSARHILVCGENAGPLVRALQTRGGVEVAQFPDAPQPGDAPIEAAALPFTDDYFACIAAADFLPRLRDPEPVLRELRRVLAPEGLLVATAPNVQCYRTVFLLAEGRWTYASTGILARRNVRFFTGVDLAETISAAGFEMRSLSSLVLAAPESVPRNADGYIASGRVRIGPLNDTEYQLYRTHQFVALAGKAKPADGPPGGPGRP